MLKNQKVRPVHPEFGRVGLARAPLGDLASPGPRTLYRLYHPCPILGLSVSCRGATPPSQIGWEASEQERMFSKHLAHGRWQPQLPFSLQFRRASLAYPLLTLVSAFGGGEAAFLPPELPLVVGEAWCMQGGHFQRERGPPPQLRDSLALAPAS